MPSISQWSDDCEATSTTAVTNASNIHRNKACAHTNTMMNQSNETSTLIRDDIQSHNGDSCANLRAPSVFASVSPFPCHNMQQERRSEDAPMHIPLNSAEENGNSLLRATSTKGPPLTRDTSVVATTAPAKQSLSNFATRLNTGTGTPVRGQIKTHVPIGSEKCVQLPPHQTRVNKRKRIPNVSTPIINSNDDSTMDLTNTGNTTSRYSSSGSTGRWTTQEHQAFVRGLALYGREWKRVALDIPTRTSAQVRSHAQKYLSKMEKQLSLSHNGNVPLASDVYSLDTVTPRASQKSIEPTNDQDYTMATAQSPSTTRLASLSHDSETSTYEDGSPTAGSQQHDTENDYQTMTDSVRQQAARILANPTTVEQEVRDTISQLRVRYLQLQERIQQQQHHQHEDSASFETDNRNDDQSRNVILYRPGRDGVEHNIIEQSCDNNITNKGNSTNDNDSIFNSNAKDFGKTNKSSASNTSSASAQAILYVHHDDDELIALHVLQGLQKQQLRI